jgi:GNAT superfamily N-acetyltransferase
MKTDWKNEHASCRVVQNPELPPEMDRVREVVRVWTDEDHRRQGYGTELMQAVCDEADVLGVVLMLQPLPFGEGVTKEKLMAWYSRFGFVKTQSKPVLMARAPSFKPRTSAVVNAVDGMIRG